jgi:hypothetical protein
MMGKSNLKHSTAFTIVIAVLIVLAGVGIACLNRFTTVFDLKPTGKRIAKKLDLTDHRWIETLVEMQIPSCKKDFSLYTAFTYMDGKNQLTMMYSTRESLDTVRAWYMDALDDPKEEGENTVAILKLRGTVNGREVTIGNYFSEVANVVEVVISADGEYIDMIRGKIVAAFPQSAIDAVPEIAEMTSGGSGSGYVLYNSDAFATDSYVNIPIFSRLYEYGGTEAELEKAMEKLSATFTGPANALFYKNTAQIKHAGYLYEIKPVTEGVNTRITVTVQRMPGGDAVR